MLPYSGFSRYIPRSIFLSLSFFSLKSRSAFPVLVLFDKRPALLLLINVFGIPDQPCADFLFILFPLRLPLPLNLIDCFILTGLYLFYAMVHPPLFDLRFANCQLNDGCNSAICISDYSSSLRVLSVYAPFVCSFSSIIPFNDLIRRHATSNEERF